MLSQMGPAPTPTVIRRMRGNPGRRPYNLREPQVKRPESTDPPPWLQGEALTIWHSLAPRFLDMGTLADVDIQGLAGACFWWGAFRKAADLLMKAKTNTDYKRAFNAAERAYHQATRGFAEFGMFPGRRTRLVANVQEADDLLTTHLARRPKIAASA